VKLRLTQPQVELEAWAELGKNPLSSTLKFVFWVQGKSAANFHVLYYLRISVHTYSELKLNNKNPSCTNNFTLVIYFII
jgi:hypothetical protein